MRHLQVLAIGVVFSVALGSTAFADVQFSIQDGRVSIVAKNATVGQILAEWARIGQTRIVNGERVPGGPVTIELSNVPEKDALDVLLRSASGYVAAPRPAAVPGASVYDRILVLPTSAAPAPSLARTPTPVYQRPGQPVFPGPAQDDDEQGQPSPNVMMPGRGPVFNTFPQPQVVNPPGMVPGEGPLELPPTPVAPTPPSGVPVPGMVVPTPQQPGMPVQQPRRPGGGPGGPDPS